jgi:ribonuclease Z
MAIHGRSADLKIVGPSNVKEKVTQLMKTAGLELSFELGFVEKEKGIVVKEKNFFVKAFPLKHSVPCNGYCFVEDDKKGEFIRKKAEELGIPVGPLYSKLAEGKKVQADGKTFFPEQVMDYSKARKGRKICFVFDTLPVASYEKEIKDADVLVHEATFAEENIQRAKETFHCTAKQAAKTAQKCNAKRLFLVHASPRIKDAEKLENEACMIFSGAVYAKDGLREKIEWK